MAATRILIIEDEFIIGQNLAEIVVEFGYEVVAHVFNAEEALEILKTQAVDLILLDINLGQGMDGIEFAKKHLGQLEVPFMFLTSHADSNTILRAKGCHPLAYLLKPFKKAEIFAALEIGFANLSDVETEDFAFVKVGTGAKKVRFQDILSLKADRVYVEIHRKEGIPVVVRESLQNWEEKLPDYFFRLNRSYIVNTRKIDEIGKRTILIMGVEIPVSAFAKRALLERLIRS